MSKSRARHVNARNRAPAQVQSQTASGSMSAIRDEMMGVSQADSGGGFVDGIMGRGDLFGSRPPARGPGPMASPSHAVGSSVGSWFGSNSGASREARGPASALGAFRPNGFSRPTPSAFSGSRLTRDLPTRQALQGGLGLSGISSSFESGLSSPLTAATFAQPAASRPPPRFTRDLPRGYQKTEAPLGLASGSSQWGLGAAMARPSFSRPSAPRLSRDLPMGYIPSRPSHGGLFGGGMFGRPASSPGFLGAGTRFTRDLPFGRPGPGFSHRGKEQPTQAPTTATTTREPSASGDGTTGGDSLGQKFGGFLSEMDAGVVGYVRSAVVGEPPKDHTFTDPVRAQFQKDLETADIPATIARQLRSQNWAQSMAGNDLPPQAAEAMLEKAVALKEALETGDPVASMMAHKSYMMDTIEAFTKNGSTLAPALLHRLGVVWQGPGIGLDPGHLLREPRSFVERAKALPGALFRGVKSLFGGAPEAGTQTSGSSQDEQKAKRDEYVRQSAQETQTNYENEAYGGPRASATPAVKTPAPKPAPPTPAVKTPTTHQGRSGSDEQRSSPSNSGSNGMPDSL